MRLESHAREECSRRSFSPTHLTARGESLGARIASEGPENRPPLFAASGASPIDTQTDSENKLIRKGCAMKLNSAQVERTLSQLQGEAIPDNHPVVPQLNNIFGEHTFFLDKNGLSIVEARQRRRVGSSVGQSCKSCQLERDRSESPGASPTRTD
jgi:hypothetical protein